MADIFDLVQNLFDMLQTAWDFAVGIISDTVFVATTIPRLLVKIPSIIASFVPSEVLVVVGVFLSVALLYKVLGREG